MSHRAFKPARVRADGGHAMLGDLLAAPLVVALIVCYVMVPLLVVVHELGHAVAAVRAGRRPAVVVGKTPALIAHRFRSFDLYFHPRLALEYFYPRTPFSEIPKTHLGTCNFDPTGLTVGDLRLICSSGPHASILAGFLFAAVAWFVPGGSGVFWIAALTAVMAMIDGLGNLVPTSHEGRLFSDGAQMASLRGLDPGVVLFQPTLPPHQSS